jgi:hypothetical protein
MGTARHFYFTIAVAAVCGWVLVALFDPSGPREAFHVGLMLGTVYGQVTVAAAWTALGSAQFAGRVLPAVLGVGGLSVAIAFMAGKGTAVSLNDVALVGGSMLGQFVLLALVLLGLRARLRLRMDRLTRQEATEQTQAGIGFRPQFAIRQLMVVTALVAVTLGIGRILVEAIDWQALANNPVGREAPIFTYVVLVNVLFTVPLALAALVRQGVVLACAIGLAFIAGATWLEIAAAQPFLPGSLTSRTNIIFWTMNATQAAWVLGLLLVARGAGYRLSRSERRP